MQNSLVHHVWKRIDKGELTELVVDLGCLYCPTGYEKEAGDFVFDWLKRNGFEAKKLEVVGDRFNVVGTLRGEGGGQSLMFNSHLDVEYGEPDDYWMLGQEAPPWLTKVKVEGENFLGRPATNCKGPMAAFLIAAKAVKECGIKLKGDLLLTAVVGEIAKAPVDEFQGPQYRCAGIGMKSLLHNGVIADCVLNAEPSMFGITWANCGAAFFKITVRGKGAIYVPFIERPKPFTENPSAIVRMAKVVEAVEEWAYRYERANRYEFPGGLIVPKVNLGAIRGGLPYKPSKTTGMCCLYLDVRTPPGKDVLSVKQELEELVAGLGLKAEVDIYSFRRGYEGKNMMDFVEAITEAHKLVFGEGPRQIDPGDTSMWNDFVSCLEVGIPAAKYGPRSASGEYDLLKIDDVYNASKVYAALMLDICSRQK